MIDTDFLWRTIISSISILILVRCYFKYSQHRENSASFILFGIGVFLVTKLLHNADVSMGFAFGLFAIFSMLRYRTEAIDIKDMTYLFLVIAIALLSAVGTMPHWQLVLLNVFIILLAFTLESSAILPAYQEKDIEYEVIKNIKPENKELLLEDLKQRTGLNIIKVSVGSVSFLKDTAMLRLHYLADNNNE